MLPRKTQFKIPCFFQCSSGMSEQGRVEAQSSPQTSFDGERSSLQSLEGGLLACLFNLHVALAG